MKNDNYLWDKSGSDPEIERLELALKIFRGQGIEPPAIVPEFAPMQFVPRETNSRGRFSFGIVSFACFMLAVFGLGVFLFNGNYYERAANKTPGDLKPSMSQTNNAKTEKPLIEERSLNTEIREDVPVDLPAVKARYRKAKRNSSTKRKILRTKVPPPKAQSLELTAEEKYAYEQLMLALSITSSNLKAVKDKVRGSE